MATPRSDASQQSASRRGAKPSTPSAQRAEMLTAKALDLFAEHGFGSVTIKNIGQAAGVNTALIYYYFEDKEDLFCAAIESAVDQAFETFKKLRERHDDPADIINDWLDTHIQLIGPIRKMVKVSLDYKGSAANSPSVDKSIRRFYRQEARILNACIRQGVERGIFQPVDSEGLAVQISTFLDGAMVRSMILPDFDPSAAVAQFKDLLWKQLDYRPTELVKHRATNA